MNGVVGRWIKILANTSIFGAEAAWETVQN